MQKGASSSSAQRKKFEVLVRYVLKAFAHGVRYSEKQVNEILSRYNEDAAYLRRSLVDAKYMAENPTAARTGG